MNFDFDYIFLNLLLLWTFYSCGKNIERGASYWKNSIPIIILFSLIEGLRYMRGVDYDTYSLAFYRQEFWGGVLWTDFNNFLYSVGFNRYTCFIAYSFIEVLGMCVFLKRYRQHASLFFPFMLVAFIGFYEHQIRQAFSYSFLLMFLSKLFNLKFDNTLIKCILVPKNWSEIIFAVVYALLAINIHSANLIILFIFVFVFLFIKFPVPWIISIPAVFISQFYISSFFDSSMFEPILNFLGDQNDLYADYVNNADYWFGEEGMKDKYSRNFWISIFEVIGVSSLLYLGEKVIKQNNLSQEYISIYNVYIIGVLIMMGFRELEIVQRIGSDMAIWWFCPLSLIVSSHIQSKYKGLKYFIYIALIWFSYDYIKFLFMRGDMTLFIWDINTNLL